MPEIVFRFSTPPSQDDYRTLAESLAMLQVFVAPSADEPGKFVPLVELDTIFPDIGNPDSLMYEEIISLTVNYSQYSDLAACFWLDFYTNGTCRYWETNEEIDTPTREGSWEEGIQEMLSYLDKLIPADGQRRIRAISQSIQNHLKNL